MLAFRQGFEQEIAVIEPVDFWQEFLPAERAAEPPFTTRYPARLTDGRILHLPIRPLAGTDNAIASLILNQASFPVEAALAGQLACLLRGDMPEVPEVIVGIPTLGLSLARAVAVNLGHSRFVALGTSRKFWYDDALSVPLNSITSPGVEKRLFVDPRMVPLLQGRRVCLIDDVISSGASICAGLDLLKRVDVVPVALGAAMLQTERWKDRLDRHGIAAEHVHGAIRTPLLKRAGDGWLPV